MKKIKVLFVVSEFWQAGCQRYTYELHKNIDQVKFKLDILSLRNLNSDPKWKDHYYNLHIELGSKIYFFNEIDKILHPKIKERVLKKISKTVNTNEHQNLIDFVDQYDIISIMGEYNYYSFSRNLPSSIKSKCFIHLQNSILQHPENYALYNFKQKHKFISSFQEKEIVLELKKFSTYEHYYMPLAITIDPNSKKWNEKFLKNKKIGIFTRLTKTKPLEPFIYALQILKKQLPDIELHIFGTGDPIESGLMDHVSYLNLNDSVFFRGHVEDLIKTSNKEQLSLVWFQGYHGVPAGHSGFEICSIGIPQIFWDFGSAYKNEFDSRFPMFKDLIDFANFNAQIMNDENLAKKLSAEQFNYVKEERNMKIEVQKLESIYSKFIENNS